MKEKFKIHILNQARTLRAKIKRIDQSIAEIDRKISLLQESRKSLKEVRALSESQYRELLIKAKDNSSANESLNSDTKTLDCSLNSKGNNSEVLTEDEKSSTSSIERLNLF